MDGTRPREGVATEQKPLPGVPVSPASPASADLRHGRKPPVIEFHEPVKWRGQGSCEDWFQKAFIPALERLGGHPKIVETQIEEKPKPHQFVIPHVFILVL